MCSDPVRIGREREEREGRDGSERGLWWWLEVHSTEIFSVPKVWHSGIVSQKCDLVSDIVSQKRDLVSDIVSQKCDLLSDIVSQKRDLLSDCQKCYIQSDHEG